MLTTRTLALAVPLAFIAAFAAFLAALRLTALVTVLLTTARLAPAARALRTREDVDFLASAFAPLPRPLVADFLLVLLAGIFSLLSVDLSYTLAMRLGLAQRTRRIRKTAAAAALWYSA